MTQHFPSAAITSSGVALAAPLGAALPRLADFSRAGFMPRVSANVVRGLLRASDVVLTVVPALVIAKLYVTDVAVLTNLPYLATAGLAGLAMLAALELFGVYRSESYASIVVQVPRIVLAAAIVFALVLAAAFFLKSGAQFSRAWLAMWFSCSVALIGSTRLLLAGLTARWARQGQLSARLP